MSSRAETMRALARETRAESPYQAIFEYSSEAILICDPVKDQILDANHNACALLEYSREALLAQHFSVLHKHELPALIVFTQAVMDKGSSWSNELSCRNSQDELIPVEYSASCFEDNSEPRLIITLRDKQKFTNLQKEADANLYVREGITEWRHIETIFQAIEHENKLILNAAGEGIYGVNADGVTTFINPAAQQMLGFTAEEIVGLNIHDEIHHSKADGSHYEVHDCPIFAAFQDGEVHTVYDEVFWRKDGTSLPVEYTSTPIKDHGRLMGAVVVFRDISERLTAEANLRDAMAEVEELKHKLEMENAYLKEEIRSEHNYHQIVGKSIAIQQVIQQIDLVAPTCANVLITGESGTGKELIAHAIHSSSLRSERPLIRVNCAVIPYNLFESEFFGHAKGSFTGAISDRIGRFELADGGTLFLDEVGEIPADLQSKLLRVLQEGQFERIGENKTRKVDVRIIAATNRDLKLDVANKRFREDLFFRLNVFPIDSAPLRKRQEDIPILATHFLERACHKLNKPDVRITQADINRMQNYAWPGNIRELANVIERAVIVSQCGRLKLDLPDSAIKSRVVKGKTSLPAGQAGVHILTNHELRSQEYTNIIAALQETNGKVFGPEGAAELLGVKPTTLSSKIKRLGIDKSVYQMPRQ